MPELSRVLRRILLSLLGLILAGLLAAGWYAYNKGFTSKWRAFVVKEFRKRGVEVSLRRLTLEPFRGIVAKQVAIYDDRERRRTVAVIDEMLLVVNYANLFQGRAFIDALDLHDANLNLPLDPAHRNGANVEIRHLSGRLLLPPKQIHLSHLEADLYGIRLRASGSLINPQAFSASIPAAATARIISEAKAITFDGPPPQLDVRFSGDLAGPGQLFVEATLWAEKLRRGTSRLESLYVEGSFRDGTLHVRQLAAGDAEGSLRASGTYDPATAEATIQLHSTLDAQSLLRSFTRIALLDEIVLYHPPVLDLTARFTFSDDPAFHILGHLHFGKFAYKSVIFDQLDADISRDNTRWAALDVRISHRSGELTGEVLHLESEVQSRLASTIQRPILTPLLTGSAAEWLPRIAFKGE